MDFCCEHNADDVFQILAFQDERGIQKPKGAKQSSKEQPKVQWRLANLSLLVPVAISISKCSYLFFGGTMSSSIGQDNYSTRKTERGEI